MKIKTRYKIAAVFLVFAFLVFLPHKNILNNLSEAVTKETVIEKVNNIFQKKPTAAELAAERKAKQQTLLSQLQSTLSINQTFQISVYDINNSESFGLNDTASVHAASVMKVLVGASALRAVESGKYKLSMPLGDYTLQYQLQQMVNQSNNYSWDYFNNLLGFKGEQATADELGLEGINVFQNAMSPKGTNELLLKLYKGNVINQSDRDLLFSYMQNTETENRIPKGLPNGVTLYHKTGSYNGEVHDAAIVVHPKNPFILTIFTNDSRGTAWETRYQSMQEATKEVYNYFDGI